MSGNTGHLKDISCPKCGSTEKFYVNTQVTLVVTDQSSHSERGAVFDIANAGEFRCAECNYLGKRKEFVRLTEVMYVSNPACPHCRSTDLEPDWEDTEPEPDPGRVSVRVICESCGQQHRAIYSLSGYEK